MTNKKLKAILTGGGTGGHVYPCLAIFKMLKKHGVVEQGLYLGIKDRAEAKIVPNNIDDIPLEFVKSAPIAGISRLSQIKACFIILFGTCQVILKIFRFKPNLVLGTGGYASAPVIFGAFLAKLIFRKKISIILEEQNLIPGMLNKVSSLMADVVLLNYKSSSFFVWSNQCVHVGYPVREEYLSNKWSKSEAKGQLGIPADKFLILITGGSLGARSINRLIAENIEELAKIPEISVMHSFGMAETDEYNAKADTVSILREKLGRRLTDSSDQFVALNPQGEKFYTATSYLNNIHQWQYAADLIITRAGAGALAELSALGKAAVVIPKRGLPGDHQELNTIELAEKKACIPLFETKDFKSGADRLDASELLDTIQSIKNQPEKLNQLELNSSSLFYKNCEQKIVKTVDKVLNAQVPDILLRIEPPQFVRLQTLFDNLISYLDRLRKDLSEQEFKENLYYRFYEKKIPEYLNSDDYLVKNKGIKLIGSFQKFNYYPDLINEFAQFQGYLKRNILSGLRKAETFEPRIEEAVIKGLNDSYYETRREAIQLYIYFYGAFQNKEEIEAKILSFLGKAFESFEVKAVAVQAAVLFLDPDSFFKIAKRYLYSRNVRLRQALLNAVQLGIDHQRFDNHSRVKQFLSGMLVSTSDFAPQFTIKKNYNRVVERLQANSGDQTHV